MVAFNRTVGDRPAGLEVAQGAILVLAHFLAEADHVGGENGGELALGCWIGHGPLWDGGGSHLVTADHFRGISSSGKPCRKGGLIRPKCYSRTGGNTVAVWAFAGFPFLVFSQDLAEEFLRARVGGFGEEG